MLSLAEGEGSKHPRDLHRQVDDSKQRSQIATDIPAQKYFRKAGVPQFDASLGKETSMKQWPTFGRKVWGERYGYFASEKDDTIFYEELVSGILNSPVHLTALNTGFL